MTTAVSLQVKTRASLLIVLNGPLYRPGFRSMTNSFITAWFITIGRPQTNASSAMALISAMPGADAPLATSCFPAWAIGSSWSPCPIAGSGT